MKKLPIIGLLIGAIAAIVIRKKKSAEPEAAPEVAGAPEDTNPPV